MNENVLTKVLKYICVAVATTALFVNCGNLIKAHDTELNSTLKMVYRSTNRKGNE